jgi:2-(1,2-epoxy-1,2-dihydrophenyl)acetyl-CoA isomerase
MSEAEPGVIVADRGAVRWIVLDRRESRNALTIELNQRIIEALDGAAAAGARAVVLAGAGGNFCSGLDLKDAMRRGPATPEQNRERLEAYFHGLIRAVRRLEVPSIAAVDGPAMGFGCDLALACDLRLVSDRASFGEIFVKRGLMPDGGGTWFLPRLVGLGRALELVFTGRSVAGDEAVRIGLATAHHSHDEFEEAVSVMADKMADGPPLALRLIKQAVYASLDGDLEAALAREAAGQLQCLQSRDFVEGVRAFFDRRSPVFTGD